MNPTKALAVLKAAYPRTVIEESTAHVYVRSLSDFGDADLQAAVWQVISQSKFFPSIAELREKVIENRLGLPTAVEAWALLDTHVGQGAERYAELPEPVRGALKDVGGTWAYKHADKPEFLRRAFVEAYDERRRAIIRTENLRTLGVTPEAARLVAERRTLEDAS